MNYSWIEYELQWISPNPNSKHSLSKKRWWVLVGVIQKFGNKFAQFLVVW